MFNLFTKSKTNRSILFQLTGENKNIFITYIVYIISSINYFLLSVTFNIYFSLKTKLLINDFIQKINNQKTNLANPNEHLSLCCLVQNSNMLYFISHKERKFSQLELMISFFILTPKNDLIIKNVADYFCNFN